jgi:hypothetical protein
MIISIEAADSLLSDLTSPSVNYVFLRDSSNNNRSSTAFIELESKTEFAELKTAPFTETIDNRFFTNDKVVASSTNRYIFKKVLLEIGTSSSTANIDKLLIAKVVGGVATIFATLPITPISVINTKTYELELQLEFVLRDYATIN